MVLSRLKELGVVPVVKIENETDALPLADALIKGGLPAAEITFRTECAEAVIKKISNERSEMLVGAGTVLTVEQALRAANAGAKFIVSPGFSEEVAKFCNERELLYIPGCVTPTELMKALSFGITTLKFFPAEAFGGLKTIKALSAAFGSVEFMPTGGINENNLATYLEFSRIACCGGSYMVKASFIKNGEFDKITELSLKARDIVTQARCK